MVQAMMAADAMPWSFRRLGLLTLPPVGNAITSACVPAACNTVFML